MSGHHAPCVHSRQAKPLLSVGVCTTLGLLHTCLCVQVSSKADKARQRLQEKAEEAAGLQQQVQDLQEQLRTAQVQLHLALQQQAEGAHGAGHAGSDAAAQLQQQKLQEADAAASALQQQLQDKAKQLSQQQQANSTLQQQLLEAQQQLVQAQQQLLQVPRQQAEVSTQQQQRQQQFGPTSAAAAADQMQVAVHRSLHGLQELLHVQSQLQLAQLQAEHGKGDAWGGALALQPPSPQALPPAAGPLLADLASSHGWQG